MCPQDEQLIHQVVEHWEDAWNRHDMTAMARLVTDDADFVNVWGMHWHGRDAIEREHADRHRTQFKDSVWSTDRVEMQFLSPGVALVHLWWGMQAGPRSRWRAASSAQGPVHLGHARRAGEMAHPGGAQHEHRAAEVGCR